MIAVGSSRSTIVRFTRDNCGDGFVALLTRLVVDRGITIAGIVTVGTLTLRGAIVIGATVLVVIGMGFVKDVTAKLLVVGALLLNHEPESSVKIVPIATPD